MKKNWLCFLFLTALLPVLFAEGSQGKPLSFPQVKATSAWDEEFNGPFDSWANLKRDYKAKGNGKADDTEALQKALSDLKDPKKSKVLYLPAGTYRITKTLTMVSIKDIIVVGADPAKTVIRWDGPQGGTMLDCNGVSYSRFGRITWDGAGKAGTAVNHGWDGKVPFANTFGEHADEVFKDVAFGIKGGSRGKMDAECVILRCRFERCSKAGVSLYNFNAADWLVWYCTFQDCRMGVTNTFGAGYYSVHNSLFRNSTEADVAMSNCGYFSVRHNTSENSKAFFMGSWRSCAGLVTIQGNTVLGYTGSTAIQVGNLGPCLLVDNTIIGSKDSQKGKPQVAVNLGETTLAVGNTFTTTNPISVSKKDKTAARMIGNKITLPEEKKVSSLNMPGTPPSKKRKIFEVAAGANAAAIQKAIDQAVSSRSERAIVHLPSGQYSISQTLVIPAGKDIQFVGDGLTTQLNWKGSEPGPILQLKGPSRAILREMHLVGDGKVEGIVIENCDQPGARVVMQQGNTRGNGKGKEGIGLLTDGLDQAEVSLYNFYHSGCKEVGVRAIGGPGMEAGKKMPGRVAIFGGASSNNTLSYDVQKGAGLSVKDVWYEGAPPRFIHFTEASSGTFTLNGAKTATGRPGPDMAATDPDFAALEIDGFTGKFTLINVIVGTNVVITEKSKSAKVFSMNHGTEEYFKNRSDDTQAVALLSTKYTPGGGAVAIPDQGSADDDFILEMLAQLREEVPRPVFPLKKDLTDVRVHRVMVSNSTIGWHLKAE